MRNYDSFVTGLRRQKRMILLGMKILEKARKKYKTFNTEWELTMLKEYIKKS